MLAGKPLLDPITAYLEVKHLLKSGLAEKNDLLGAAAGIARLMTTEGTLENFEMLGPEDNSLLATVRHFLEEDDHLEWCSPDQPVVVSQLTCFVDLGGGFVKKELLHQGEPQVYLVHEAFGEKELEEILASVRDNKELVHLYSLYKDYVSSHPVQSPSVAEMQVSNLSSSDWQIFANSQKLGREGKVFFPGKDSKETPLIEDKLKRLKVVGEGEAALQV